jgi:rRNA-processing protein FCF1
MQIIPDTNFLIYLAKYNLFNELENYNLIILSQVINELERLSKNKRKKVIDRNSALLSLEFLKERRRKRKISIRKQKGYADSAILSLAKKLKIPIATMDKEMSQKAKKMKIVVMKIRQKKYLM